LNIYQGLSIYSKLGAMFHDVLRTCDHMGLFD